MSKVVKMYDELVKKGYTKKDAAIEAQKKTGMSVRTGRRIKAKGEYDGKTRQGASALV